MMLCFGAMDFVDMDFVDRDRGVHNFWLDGLPVNHRLDVFVNYRRWIRDCGQPWGQNLNHTMMVHMLSFNSVSCSSVMLRFMGHAGVLESCSFAFELRSCLRSVIMLEILVLHWGDFVTVLL